MMIPRQGKQEIEKASAAAITSTQWQWVNIYDITVDPSFQSTNRLDPSTVKEYAGKYEAGVDMPSIELALINGLKVLINGEHRLEAQKSIEGTYRVKAVVKPMSTREAYIAAIRANTDNGKQLTQKQKWEKVERLYVIKAYKDDNGRPRTWEGIASEINYAIKPRFISNWMRREHPKTYHWMMKDKKKDPEYKGGGGLRETTVQRQEDAKVHLNRAELAFYNDSSDFGKHATVSEVREMLQRMECDLGTRDELEH